MDEVLEADRLVVLHEGHVVLDDTPRRLFRNRALLQRYGLDLPPIITLAEVLSEALPELDADVLTVQDLVEAIENARQNHQRGGEIADRTAESPDPTPAGPGHGDMSPSSRSDRTIIRVRALGHIYMQDTPFARQALHDVDLDIQTPGPQSGTPVAGTNRGQAHQDRGGAHGLIGATGSGKSTLLQHLNGLLRPQEGHVQVLSYDLTDSKVDLRVVRRKVGLAFQRPEAQIFEQYVGDEIAYGPRLTGLQGEPLRERVRWAMNLVGLDFDTFKDRFTFALSGGEQRKVALASVLALRPEILLLDEPTAGLDPASKSELMAHLGELQHSGITLVLSSHEMEDVATLTERVSVLSKGTVTLDGSVSAVFSDGPRLQSLGLALPIVTQVSESLRARGWHLPAGIVDPITLRDALISAMACWRSTQPEPEEQPSGTRDRAE
jgi:energy-coupling factor transport system ATP-binding protein